MALGIACLLASMTASAAVLRSPLPGGCTLEADVRRDERPACLRLRCDRQSMQTLVCDATALHQIDQVTQENALMVRHVVQEAQALEQRAATLSEAVERFRLQQGTAEEAVTLVERAQAQFEAENAKAIKEQGRPASGTALRCSAAAKRQRCIDVCSGSGGTAAGWPLSIATMVK